MEPGFYRCKSCKRAWSRQEFKMQKNPPRICPYCGSEDQETDRQREDEYVKSVYGPIANVLTEKK